MSYIRAESLEQALDLLKEYAPEPRVIAGGTDLFLQELPENLIDIGSLEIIKMIEEKEGLLEIGAAVTHSMAANAELIISKATALAEACSQVGSPQVRNIGTLGGNVMNAAPAADAAVALVALGAKAELIDTLKNKRCLAVDQLYASYNCTAVDCSSELLLKFLLDPCKTGEGSAFVRLAARRALALPMVNAAARVSLEDGVISGICLVAAPIKPAPTRLFKTENYLLGKPAVEATWQEAEKMAAEEAEVRGSLLRCSADYRKQMVGVMVGRALRTAALRALGGKDVR
jgi:CO/xanthine dehydrogenase FAD-binding subunit